MNEDLIARLREACGVLDEPFHHDAICVALNEAADALAQADTRERQAFDDYAAGWHEGYHSAHDDYQTVKEAFTRYQQQERGK
jgi:hypothetical protein